MSRNVWLLSSGCFFCQVKRAAHGTVAKVVSWSMRQALKGKMPTVGPFGEGLTGVRAEKGLPSCWLMAGNLLILLFAQIAKPAKRLTTLIAPISTFKSVKIVALNETASMEMGLCVSKTFTLLLHTC